MKTVQKWPTGHYVRLVHALTRSPAINPPFSAAAAVSNACCLGAILLTAAAAFAVEPGVLPANWITGGPDCSAVPTWQIHPYNPTFTILRQSGCTHYEKPFLYLIVGADRALLVDTGAGASDAAAVVMKLVGSKPLTVAHSHGHGDHTAGDKGFDGVANVAFVPAAVDAQTKAFGIRDNVGAIDLGGRIVDILAIPGHQPAHLAYYDRQTGILLTGDHLYPGRLYVSDFAAYEASTRRLVEFTATRPVAHILGCHIEQSATPFVDYPVRTTYQPNEHSLELGRAHLLELLAGLEAMRAKPEKQLFRDFTIWPR
ncbi:MAG TPA: MBL fold metallo-hydrolase [Gemmataceae bacterium]|nr:MBL fold metallo-hydrolase [Gemmataceae bacterium]